MDSKNNIDNEVVEDFGKEWNSFTQTDLSKDDLDQGIQSYFRIFPYDKINSESIGAERAPVEITREGRKRIINIGRKIQGEIELVDGKSPDQPVMVSNTKYWMGSDVLVAVGKRSKVRDYGRVWDFDGKSAEICPIEWSGP